MLSCWSYTSNIMFCTVHNSDVVSGRLGLDDHLEPMVTMHYVGPQAAMTGYAAVMPVLTAELS